MTHVAGRVSRRCGLGLISTTAGEQTWITSSRVVAVFHLIEMEDYRVGDGLFRGIVVRMTNTT